MRRNVPLLWAGTGILAALLICSCQHRRCCCCCGAKYNVPSAATLAKPLTTVARPVPAGTAPVLAKPTNLPAALPQAPMVHTTAKVNPTAAEKSKESSPSLNDPSEEAQTHTSEGFGHDPNYRWLVGTLDYSQIQRAWILRYLSYEQDDRYGGSVTLVGSMPEKALKKGTTVRVEGTLIDPDSRHLRPAFQVENIRAAGS